VAPVGDFWFKRKAIVALFPYAVRQDRGGDRRVVDAFLGIAKAPGIGTFMAKEITTLLEEASPDSPNQVVTLLSRYADWEFPFGGDTVTWWAAAVVAVPYTEEVGQSVVDTLLQIASVNELRPYIPVDIWSWLKKRPSLPPVCRGRSVGTTDQVVRAVRELGDLEILESYLLLVWSEWDIICWGGVAEMHTLIREDLGGIGMGRHREVLIKRLDHILGELGRGRWYLNQHNPEVNVHHIPTTREQYGELKGSLLEVDRKALEVLTRTPFKLITLFNLLTCADVHRITLDIHLCTPSPMSVVVCPRHSLLDPPTPCFTYTWVPLSPLRLVDLHR